MYCTCTVWQGGRVDMARNVPCSGLRPVNLPEIKRHFIMATKGHPSGPTASTGVLVQCRLDPGACK